MVAPRHLCLTRYFSVQDRGSQIHLSPKFLELASFWWAFHPPLSFLARERSWEALFGPFYGCLLIWQCKCSLLKSKACNCLQTWKTQDNFYYDYSREGSSALITFFLVYSFGYSEWFVTWEAGVWWLR